MVKNLPAKLGDVGSIFGLKKEMTTHSSSLAWKTPWTEEPGGLQSMGSQKNQTKLNNSTTTTNFHSLDLGLRSNIYLKFILCNIFLKPNARVGNCCASGLTRMSIAGRMAMAQAQGGCPYHPTVSNVCSPLSPFPNQRPVLLVLRT